VDSDSVFPGTISYFCAPSRLLSHVRGEGSGELRRFIERALEGGRVFSQK